MPRRQPSCTCMNLGALAPWRLPIPDLDRPASPSAPIAASKRSTAMTSPSAADATPTALQGRHDEYPLRDPDGRSPRRVPTSTTHQRRGEPMTTLNGLNGPDYAEGESYESHRR